MNEEFFIEPLFSSPVYNSFINIDIKPFLNFALKQKKAPHYDTITNQKQKNISLSSLDLNVLKHKPLKKLNDKIIEHINTYTKDVLKYETDFKLTTSWLTFTDPGSSSQMHRHQNSKFSGIVYLQTDENSGDLSFENYNCGDFMLNIKEYNIYNSELWKYKPFNNKIIIFPSHLHHKILKNNSNIQRVSLAFNLMPVGTFGRDDSTLTLKY